MKLKDIIIETIKATLDHDQIDYPEIEVEIPNDTSHGDFSTNIAMKLARVLRKSPLVIAEELIERLNFDQHLFHKIEVARPGFINFYVNKAIYLDLIHAINTSPKTYGNLDLGKGEHYNIEFVSANPTGSLHIGHARGAAAGDALARILVKAGYQVTKEFYVNDGGNQINQLAHSIKARYLQALGVEAEVPEDGYHGREIIQLAKDLVKEIGDRYLHEDGFEFFKAYGVDNLLKALEKDLKAFNVEFDIWFKESILYNENKIAETINVLTERGYTYQEANALWLKTSEFGDEKDRVIVKSDGSYTYLLPDIAYHHDKLSRGYTKLIDILGGDHHGYVPRLKAAITMFTGKDDMLDVDLLQMVKVIQNGEEVKMSKRSGKSITLADLIAEVGKDPIRYFFAMRSLNTHMDLDLDLALKESNENPVFYAQYAHARIASLFNQAKAKGYAVDTTISQFTTLKGEKIEQLLTVLSEYPEAIEEAASKRIPHKITHYIHRLAQALHSFYADEIILSDDQQKVIERLALLHAVKAVLRDALELVGVEAKERM